MKASELMLIPLLLVFFFSVVILLRLIPFLQKKKMGQRILEIGPKWHKNKEGTPTMGGLAPALACAVVCIGLVCIPLGLSPKDKIYLVLTLLFGLGNGAIGVVDDLTKFRHRRNDGLTPRQKLVLQTATAGAYLALLSLYGGISTSISLPFMAHSISLGWIYYPLALLFMVGTVNFCNLTDGIDGLASAVHLVVAGFFIYLGVSLYRLDLLFLSAAMFGGALAFLLFNYHPARIFMGDTGSLFFGGMAVGCAFLCGMPWILLFSGIVYYIEGLSVILQVAYFKLTHGKRLFKMAPFHHHLEKNGFSEEKIVFVMTLVSLFGAILGALVI